MRLRDLLLVIATFGGMGIGVLIPETAGQFKSATPYLLMALMFLSFLRLDLAALLRPQPGAWLEVALWSGLKLLALPLAMWAVFRWLWPDWALAALALSAVSAGVTSPFFASLLGPAQVAAIDSAFRLFQLPQGMFAIAIGTVLFPVLSGFFVQKELHTHATILQTGIRQIFFVTLPFTGWFIALAFPISRLCFERGVFTTADSRMVAWALLFFAIGMSFTSANTLLNRGFYSLKKTWIPLRVAAITVALNAFLDWLLIQYLGHAGICLSTSLVSMFNFFALCHFMKKEAPAFHFKPVISAIVRAVCLTLPLTFISYVTWTILEQRLGTSLFAQITTLGGGLAAGALVYAIFSFLFRFQEVREGLILFKKEKGVS